MQDSHVRKGSGLPMSVVAVLACVLALGCGDESAPSSTTDVDEAIELIPDTSTGDAHGASDTRGDDTDGSTDRDVDAALPDTSPDHGAYGAPCQRDVECLSELCVVIAPGAGEGFCTEMCQSADQCPDESECVLIRNEGPDATRVCVPTNYCLDRDGDGYGHGPGCRGSDCDDNDPTVYSGAPELCDGIDNSCNGSVDDRVVGEGEACDTGFLGVCTAGQMTCDDARMSCRALRTPSEEMCNGLDDDCDGVIDEDAVDAGTWYRDADGDRFGDPDDVVVACERPEGYVEVGGDCDDTDPLVSPVGREICDGIDNNCNGVIDEGFEDDGIASCDEDPSTGCETDLLTTSEHCGACGVTCPEGVLCTDGACACPLGQVVCGDSCAPANVCDGCAALDDILDTSCGPCDMWACDGTKALRCDGPTPNGCGGCEALASAPDDACGTCGTYVCDGINTLRCEDRAPNACGGCSVLDPEPGTSCGDCGDYVCDGEEGVRCDGPGVNVCGGCSPLETAPGLACGYCGTGLTACAGPSATTCSGATAPASDDRHCGVCDNACTDGRRCVDAVCSCPEDLVSFAAQPASVDACLGENVSFAVSVVGEAVGYQWQVSANAGATWTDLTAGASYAGVQSPTLTVQSVTNAMNGNVYRLAVTTTCSTVMSGTAELRRTTCGETEVGAWSACTGFAGTCGTTGTRSRTITTHTCGAGVCTSSTSTESESCVREAEGAVCDEPVNGAWGACGGFSSTCDTTGTRTRSVTTYACSGGSCVASTGTETGACTRTTNGTSCGTTQYGSWSACGGFSGTCGNSGIRTRSVTTYACSGGSCAPTTSTESESCSRNTNGTSCGTTQYGSWSACGGFSGTCGNSGTRTRSVTTYACSGGSCASTSSTESESCTRNTNGTSCGTTVQGPWSACGGFSGTCGNDGTRTRSVTTYTCSGGSCASSTTTETGPCTRNTNGTSCGTTVVGSWSACGGYSGTCGNNGTRTRSVTTYTCSGGSCASSTTTETQACTRNTNGTSCGTTLNGAWSACGGFSGTCGNNGTRTRSVTTYTCSGGTCTSSTTTETGSCTRNTNGTSCGTTTFEVTGFCGPLFGDELNDCWLDGQQPTTTTTYTCSSGTCTTNETHGSMPCSRDTACGVTCTGWQGGAIFLGTCGPPENPGCFMHQIC